MSDTSATTELAGISYTALWQSIRTLAAEHDLPLPYDDETGLTLGTEYGSVRITPSPEGSRAEIKAPHAEYLQVLKDTVVAQIGAVAPQTAQAIRWDDTSATRKLPANARLMAVSSVEPLNCDFLRVTLRGDVSRFTDDAIHFRLGLPPTGRSPKWPTIGANGATQWPKGADALHLPVYTARHVDAESSTLCFDLFAHEGGRTMKWAETVPPGSEVLVTSPGGGGCRISTTVQGFADETGFPAVARILETNPDLKGSFKLFAGRNGAIYPFPAHNGVRIEYANPGTHCSMAETAKAIITSDFPAFLWFSGERSQSSAVRTAWRQAGGSARNSYISAYWQKTS
jgi:NADPH-dependent ferric siderophore reductase